MITILCVGKQHKLFLDAEKEYLKRFGCAHLIELKECKEQNSDLVVRKESQALRERLERIDGEAWLLDVAGEFVSSSEEFAGMVKNACKRGTQIVFVIGGAYGVDDTLRKVCAKRLSLSPFTFTHQIARVLLLEQLYRAQCINQNKPYHK